MSDTPLGPKGHRALMSGAFCHDDILECDEMTVVAIFFSEEIGQINISGNMFNVDVVGDDAFADGVFSNLYVS